MKPRFARIQTEQLGDRIMLSTAPITLELNDVSVVAGPEPMDANPTADSRPQLFGSDAELKQWLIDQAVQQYSWYLGRTIEQWPYWYCDYPAILGAETVSFFSTSATGTRNFSETNNQENGVDEGDLVETDGQYLYVLANEQLVILDAWPATDLAKLSETPLAGYSQAMYLHGNRLTVITQEYDYGDTFGASFRLGWRSSFNATVHVTVFDVSDRSDPKVVQETILDGTFSDSRAIGDRVYVAVNNWLTNLPFPEVVSQTQGATSGSDVNALMIARADWVGGSTLVTYESEASYRACLEAMPLEDLLPGYTTRWTAGNAEQQRSGLLTTAHNLYKPTRDGDTNLISLVSFDISGGKVGPTDSVGILTSYGATLYATQNNFYLLDQRWTEDGDLTVINKLSVHEGHLQLTATGEVPGRIVDQFSISENGQYLYIATTTGWGMNASNNVYVLDQHAHALEIVGRVEGIAPGESIFSARFLGDRGFVSTFRRVDPLFTLDLSDPTHPVLTGELHVTGYNGYLQMLDDTHLIGIGQDEDPVTGRVEDFQISLYDVSDMNHPALLSRYVVPVGGWSWSLAEYDHHAITYYGAFHVLALPVSGYDADGYYESRQLVFDVDLAHGKLTLKGEVSDSSAIERGVFIHNMLYSISSTSIQVHSLQDLGKLVAKVELGESVDGFPIRSFTFIPGIVVAIDVPLAITNDADVAITLAGDSLPALTVTQTPINVAQGGIRSVGQPSPSHRSVGSSDELPVDVNRGPSFSAPVHDSANQTDSGNAAVNPAGVPVSNAGGQQAQSSSGSGVNSANEDMPEQTPRGEEQEEILDDAWRSWSGDALCLAPADGTRVDGMFASMGQPEASGLWAVLAEAFLPVEPRQDRRRSQRYYQVSSATE